MVSRSPWPQTELKEGTREGPGAKERQMVLLIVVALILALGVLAAVQESDSRERYIRDFVRSQGHELTDHSVTW